MSSTLTGRRELQRAMNAEEQAALETALQEIAGDAGPQAWWSLVFLTGMATALLYLAWTATSWLLRALLDVTWTAAVQPWVLPVAAAGSLLVAASLCLGTFGRLRRHRGRLREDLDVGLVSAAHYRITAVKCFREPEHGGLLYFLRTGKDDVLVLYEPQGPQSGSSRTAAPRGGLAVGQDLELVRAPRSQITLARRFSGAALPVPAALALTLPPDRWPEDESLCAVPWDHLERYLAGR